MVMALLALTPTGLHQAGHLSGAVNVRQWSYEREVAGAGARVPKIKRIVSENSTCCDLKYRIVIAQRNEIKLKLKRRLI